MMTEQRRATVDRYNASPKRRATNARYYASARGRAVRTRGNAEQNPRRVYIGKRYVGTAATSADATGMNAHIKDRLHAFIKGQQARAEAESV